MSGWAAFTLGVSAAVVARALGPMLARRGRPLARAAIKQAIILGEGSRSRVEGLREDWEDLVAEAREELRTASDGAATSMGEGKP